VNALILCDVDNILRVRAQFPELPGRIRLSEANLSFDDLRARYAEASVAVLPLHDVAYSVGQTILGEMMSCGLAIVASNVMPIADYVEDRKTCLLVEPGDDAGMAAAIHKLLVDRDLAKQLGTKAAQRARETFDVTVPGRAHREIASALAGESRR